MNNGGYKLMNSLSWFDAKTIKDAHMLMLGAKMRLDASKWVNHNPTVCQGQHCTVTPINTQDRESKNSSREALELAYCITLKCCNEITDTYYDSIPQWNDRPERTREQVELAYKMAIERLESAVPNGRLHTTE